MQAHQNKGDNKMNNQQTEEYTEYLAKLYSSTHKNHMNLINSYVKGIITYDELKPLDKLYTERIELIQDNITEFLRIKNTL